MVSEAYSCIYSTNEAYSGQWAVICLVMVIHCLVVDKHCFLYTNGPYAAGAAISSLTEASVVIHRHIVIHWCMLSVAKHCGAILFICA